VSLNLIGKCESDRHSGQISTSIRHKYVCIQTFGRWLSVAFESEGYKRVPSTYTSTEELYARDAELESGFSP
jgi:hypothetical protein